MRSLLGGVTTATGVEDTEGYRGQVSRAHYLHDTTVTVVECTFCCRLVADIVPGPHCVDDKPAQREGKREREREGGRERERERAHHTSGQILVHRSSPELSPEKMLRSMA